MEENHRENCDCPQSVHVGPVTKILDDAICGGRGAGGFAFPMRCD